MPLSASWAMQTALYAALSNHPALSTLLGGTHIYDDIPQSVSAPYITIGQNSLRDWSTGTEGGYEHELVLNVWSRSGGRKQVQDIAEAVHEILHDQTLTLTDHKLVNLRQIFLDVRREPDGEFYRAIMRFRAITEPN